MSAVGGEVVGPCAGDVSVDVWIRMWFGSGRCFQIDIGDGVLCCHGVCLFMVVLDLS